MTAKIKAKTEVAKGTLLVELSVNPEEAKFIPGQYMSLKLINPPFTDEKGDSRFFSIIYFPNSPDTIGFTTRLRDSAFKKSIQEFPIGTEVNIKAITGQFVLPKTTDKELVFIAGGIGITPFLSMIRFAHESNFKQKITLIYSNRDKESTAYFEELEGLSGPNFKVIFTMTEDLNWQGEKRMISSDFIKEYIPNFQEKIFYVAGPPAMVSAIHSELKKLSLPDDNIKIEDFEGY